MAAFPGSVASTAGHTAWRLGRSLVQHGWDAVGAWEHGPRGAADWERSAGGGPIRLTGPFSPGVADSGLRHRRGRRCGLAPGKPGVKAQPRSLLRIYRRSWRLCCDRQAASNTGPGRLTGLCQLSHDPLCPVGATCVRPLQDFPGLAGPSCPHRRGAQRHPSGGACEAGVLPPEPRGSRGPAAPSPRGVTALRVF